MMIPPPVFFRVVQSTDNIPILIHGSFFSLYVLFFLAIAIKKKREREREEADWKKKMYSYHIHV